MSQTHLQRAEEAEQRRQYFEAIEHYERAIKSASNSSLRAAMHREFASSLIFWGMYPRAIEELQASVTLDPNQARAWHDLGILLSKAKKAERAMDALLKAKALAPNDPRPRIALAALWVRASQWRRAEEEYRSLLTLKLPDKIHRAVEKALVLIELELSSQPPPQKREQ